MGAAQRFAALKTAGFVGERAAIDDLDLPRLGALIGVGEDEIHAFLEVETRGGGFDASGRPKMLFEPHVFYRNLSGAKRDRAVREGLAWRNWKPGVYPADSYPRLKAAMAIDETAALRSASWGIAQVLGENHVAAGFDSVQALVAACCDDEAAGLAAAVSFIKANGLDDELRRLAGLTRTTTPDDCRAFCRGYNGPGYADHGYHVKLAAAHNRWRRIPDTPWPPPAPPVEPDVAPPPPGAPMEPRPLPQQPAGKPGFWARLAAALTGRTI